MTWRPAEPEPGTEPEIRLAERAEERARKVDEEKRRLREGVDFTTRADRVLRQLAKAEEVKRRRQLAAFRRYMAARRRGLPSDRTHRITLHLDDPKPVRRRGVVAAGGRRSEWVVVAVTRPIRKPKRKPTPAR